MNSRSSSGLRTKFLFTFGALLAVGISPVQPVRAQHSQRPSVAQKISSSKISGGCLQNRNYPGQVVLEEKYDPKCRVTVTLTGNVQRTVALKWWDEEDETWYEESRKKTVGGKVTINIDPRSCGDNYKDYCDGTYEYRIVVLASTKPKLGEIKGKSFDVTFIALSSGDDYECDPDYEDC